MVFLANWQLKLQLVPFFQHFPNMTVLKKYFLYAEMMKTI